MRRFTLREREAVPIGAPEGLSEAEAAAFARFEAHLPPGAFQWEHRAIRFGPFCGVVRAGEVTVELLPKTDAEWDTDENARGLLVAMLRATGALLMPRGDAALGQQRMHLLDVFLLDFCTRVQNALRAGPIATYREQQENLNAVRGRLKLAQHLRLNAFDQSRLLCEFDERTVDNRHNRSLKFVLSSLLKEARGIQAKGAVTAVLHRLDGVTATSVSRRDIELLPFDRMTRRWQPVFERAKWLLAGLFPDVRIGEVAGTCLLFNMERLFEAFVAAKIGAAWRDLDAVRFRVKVQGPILSLAATEGGVAFPLRPDVVVLDGEAVVRIFDAKWKRLDPNHANWGISQFDVYQLAAYATRYGCKRVGLVYPASLGCPSGLVGTYVLNVAGSPALDVFAVDLKRLGSGEALPLGMRSAPDGVGPERFGTRASPEVRARFSSPELQAMRPVPAAGQS